MAKNKVRIQWLKGPNGGYAQEVSEAAAQKAVAAGEARVLEHVKAAKPE